MRRTICRLFVALFFTFTASTADAGPIHIGDSIKFADAPGTTGGGEFLVTINNLEQFITFCLQRTEYIDYSTTFKIGGISPYAMTDAPEHGGASGTGYDPLSSQTAWLYTQFRANTLAGYDYLGPDRWQSANALQMAIWWFEGEIATNPDNAFVAAANAAVAGGWTGIGDVRAMNLFFPDGREAQDQLALVPTAVPEPTTFALLGSGLGLGAWRRFRQRRNRES